MKSAPIHAAVVVLAVFLAGCQTIPPGAERGPQGTMARGCGSTSARAFIIIVTMASAAADHRPTPIQIDASRVAGRRTCDTRDEFCASVSFIGAGVLLPRPAHTKTSCVGFRETQRP